MDIKRQYYDIIEEMIDYLKTGFNSRKMSLYTERENSPSNEQEISKREHLARIDKEILKCTKCPLHLKRLNAVPGKGNINADIIFIGEGPGEMEDIKGEPFVGKAGGLLTRMFAAIQLKRDEVFITNVVKCRPPDNRTPLPEEINTCYAYLERQIALIDPSIICCLGGPAIQTLLGSGTCISKLRGTVHRYKDISLIPTYHPSAVLRFPERYKRAVWNDLKMLRDFYRELKK